MSAGTQYAGSNRPDDGHLCDYPGCRQSINAAFPMCTPHWRHVPELLRKVMFPRKPDDSGYQEALRQAIPAVREVVDKGRKK